VMKGLLTAVYDMIMLTDESGMLSGEEQIVVSGVKVAIQKETERQKQLQFLQITANPIDAPILGKPGRARVLRSVAQNLGMPDDVVPDDQEIAQQLKAEQDLQKAQIALQAHSAAMTGQLGRPEPPEQQGPPGRGGQGASPASRAQGAQAPAATPSQHSDIAPPMNSFQQGTPYNG